MCVKKQQQMVLGFSSKPCLMTLENYPTFLRDTLPGI